MAESYVVDASVVAKWFNRGEDYEDKASAVRKAWVDDELELIAPSHLPFEVANSIWKNPNIKARNAGILAKLMVRLSPRLDSLSEELAQESMSLARRKGLTFYDASYLALAKFLSRPLLTADAEQLVAAARYVVASHLASFGKTST